ncbi:serine/arginine-rich SC35-like splicing factor SCL30A [Tanacetum coccineum]
MGGRCYSPSPMGRYGGGGGGGGGGRDRDLPTSLLVRNLRHDCREQRGFGFVQFLEPADVAEAKYHMDGQKGYSNIIKGDNGRFNDHRRSPPPCYSRSPPPRYSRSPPPRNARSRSNSREYSPPLKRKQHVRSISPGEKRLVEKGRTHDRLLLEGVHHLQGVFLWTTRLCPTTGQGVQVLCNHGNVAAVQQGSKPEQQGILAAGSHSLLLGLHIVTSGRIVAVLESLSHLEHIRNGEADFTQLDALYVFLTIPGFVQSLLLGCHSDFGAEAAAAGLMIARRHHLLFDAHGTSTLLLGLLLHRLLNHDITTITTTLSVSPGEKRHSRERSYSRSPPPARGRSPPPRSPVVDNRSPPYNRSRSPSPLLAREHSRSPARERARAPRDPP